METEDLKFKNAQAILTKFRDYVVSQSRANLSKQNKNVTKGLYESIKGDIITEDGFSIVEFNLGKYGSFQDQGIKGSVHSNKAPNSPFSFKSKPPPYSAILKWVKARGFLFRNKENGRMMSAKTTSYLVQRSIFKNGIKPSLFFTKPFEAGYKKYIDVSLVLAFGEDVGTLVSYELDKLPNEISNKK